MAWALVSAIKDRLSSFITSEFTSIANVEGEVQKLESKFHTIQAMLNDAEKRQVKEEAVKLWLDKLKDVSYLMDDVLDEWNTAMIKAEIEKQQKDDEEKAETSSAAKKRKVWPLISVPILLQHRDFAHKIKELNEKLDEIDKEGEKYEFVLTRGNEEVERPRTTSFVDVSEILGRDKVRDDLVSILLGKGSEEVRNPHVISLVGMGGIGKTTLAQLAYNDNEVQAHFEIKVWVCVSDPFDQCKVAKEILESIEGQSPLTTLQSLLDRICDKVRGKKFFLVFDDMWTEDFAKWEPFRDALKNCGSQSSKVLVTTRKDEVAWMMESANMIKLQELLEEDCWSMFSKIAFFDKDPQQCEQLEDLGRQISKKCKGLPLAAKTLGSLMRLKKSTDDWKNVLNSNLWELEYVERGLFAPLLLSYYDLSAPLRRCFSFCAVFPKDYVFPSDELVFMWMAQGYIKSKKNVEIEIIARDYFENLAVRSFFQDFERDENDGKIKKCKMHDIVHDFAQLMSKDVCFTINSNIELETDYKTARHLELEILKEAQFPESIYSAKNLHTLIFVNRSDYMLSTLFWHFRCLRILTLDFKSGGTVWNLPDAVENFIHLRYLKLVNYCGDALPETICNLCNLQILNIKIDGKKFQKLPQGMSKLINLRHFDLGFKDGFLNVKFPRGFGRLTSLRTLCSFSVNGKDDSERCKLGELINLNHLKTLEISGLGSVVDECEAMNAQLKKKINLHTLTLIFKELDGEEIIREQDALVLNALEPPSNLEYLRILYYEAPIMFPNWMMSLTNLKELGIYYSSLECLPPLGKLPFLKSLKMRAIRRLKKLGVEFMGIEESEKKEKGDIIIPLFPNLISIEFWGCDEWEEWNGIEEEEDCIRRFIIMPRLQDLKIFSCHELKSLPNFLRTTPLQKLQISYCRILEEHCKRGTGKEWPKISHIPNILIRGIFVQRDGREYESKPKFYLMGVDIAQEQLLWFMRGNLEYPQKILQLDLQKSLTMSYLAHLIVDLGNENQIGVAAFPRDGAC
ncbi:putative disease resistance protein RGA3 [Castanea sativa]|uniref:putative disease resistance protein RGA3 n=1 Tax=Castanea sativa TaxID=21020 RepID=UPI003F650D1A